MKEFRLSPDDPRTMYILNFLLFAATSVIGYWLHSNRSIPLDELIRDMLKDGILAQLEKCALVP